VTDPVPPLTPMTADPDPAPPTLRHLAPTPPRNSPDQHENPTGSAGSTESTAIGRTGPSGTVPTPFLYRVTDAVRFLGVSRSVLFDLLRSGRLRSVKEGQTRLIPADAITGYVALLNAEAGWKVAA
jgi:excisionase family DNA binding protein